MSTGLIALLDDVAGLAKVAAASLDDAAAQATRAGVKAAGIVIDDAAVTPRYVTGFTASRELPIVGKIALGSLKNKLFFLLPAALALSVIAPWAINPLLMLGGAYLCFEGTEKVYHAIWPESTHEVAAAAVEDAGRLEDQKVSSAIKTDFILSAEIMAITLSTLPASSFLMQALVLAVVGIGITVLVYGVVALIVKADDAGVALAGDDRPMSRLVGLVRRRVSGNDASAADRFVRPATQGFGRGLVIGMPMFLQMLTIVGTAAMVWVGGGILLHGLAEYGLGEIAHTVEAGAAAAGQAVPAAAGLVEWAVNAAGSGIFGLLVGAALIPFVQRVAMPLLARFRPAVGERAGPAH